MAKEKNQELPPVNKEAAVIHLSRLTKQNSIRAYISLFGLICIFFVTLFFFLFPEKISTGMFNTSDTEINLEAQLLKVIKDVSDLDEAIKEKSISTKADGFDRFMNLFSNSTPLKELREKYIYTTDKHKFLQNQMTTLRENKLNGLKLDTTAKSIENIIATSITRAGSVLLTLFIMQILLGFYRYFIRLTNYYSEKLLTVVSSAIPAKTKSHV